MKALENTSTMSTGDFLMILFLGPHIMSAPGSELGILEQVKKIKI